MMPRWVIAAAGGLLFVLYPTSASGQAPPSQRPWGATAYTGVSPWVQTGLLDIDDASQATTAVFGVAVERALTNRFAVEGDLQVVPHFLKRSGPDSLLTRSRLVVASAGLVGRLRTGSRLMPRAAIGIASVQYSAHDRLSALDQDSTLLGITASGGAVLRMSGPLAVRFDVRYLRTQRDVTLGLFDDAYIDLMQVTLGMKIAW